MQVMSQTQNSLEETMNT